MWVFNVFLLLVYLAGSPMYDGLVGNGATWYVCHGECTAPAPDYAPPAR